MQVIITLRSIWHRITRRTCAKMIKGHAHTHAHTREKLTDFFNGFDPGAFVREGVGSDICYPHTLHNKFSENGILWGWFRYDKIIETPHGTIYIEDIL